VTAEIAEISRNVDDVLEEVKAGEPVEIVVRNVAVAEVAPMPKHYDVLENGTVVDQTSAYDRVEELVQKGVLRGTLQPLSDDFFSLPRPAMPGILDDLLRDRYGDDYDDE
jgi:prevent-host-death family protein